MPKIDNEKFYISAIQKHGVSAKGVNWASSHSQKTRFRVICELLPSDLSSVSIIDAGCGFADFYTYLQKKKNLPKAYIGIDALEDMSAIASNNTGCQIITADIIKEEIPQADYVVCSGAMNVLEKFETYQFIQNCFQASTIAFVFNILHGDKESQTYNYFTKQQLQNIANDLNVTQSIYKEDYMEDDITAIFFK